MKKLSVIALSLLAAFTTFSSQARTPPGERSADTTSAPSNRVGAGKAAKVKPAAMPTDPSAPMETTSAVDKNGAVPAEQDARRAQRK